MAIVKKISLFCVLIVSVVLSIGGSICIYINKKEYSKGEEAYVKASELYIKKTSIEEPHRKKIKKIQGSTKVNVSLSPEVDFDKLKKVNADIVGWLRYDAIGIDYPIVQGEDNDHYLYYTYENIENVNGSIFLNCSNKSDFTDPHSIIYGHNMDSGRMFGSLKRLLTENDILEKYRTFWLCTPDHNYQYEIFSVHHTPREGESYTIFGEKDEYFTQWVKNMQNLSEYELSEGQDISGNIITLSTCTSTEEDRLVVHARQMEKM